MNEVYHLCAFPSGSPWIQEGPVKVEKTHLYQNETEGWEVTMETKLQRERLSELNCFLSYGPERTPRAHVAATKMAPERTKATEAPFRGQRQATGPKKRGSWRRPGKSSKTQKHRDSRVKYDWLCEHVISFVVEHRSQV